MQLPSIDRYASARSHSASADNRPAASNRLQSVRSQTSDNAQPLTASIRELPALPAKEVESLANRKLDRTDTPTATAARQDAGVQSLTTLALARSSQNSPAARTARANQAVEAYRRQNGDGENDAATGQRSGVTSAQSDGTRTERATNGPQARAQQAREAQRRAQTEVEA